MFLPQGLKVGGTLDLTGTPITSLPQDLIVNGDLDLANVRIASLPQSLQVGGVIRYFRGDRTEAPPHLQRKII